MNSVLLLNFDEASVCGRRAGKWSGERREALCGTKPERNAAAEPQTEARRICGKTKCR